jgi:phosphoribosylanthranilate isomerase
MPVRVKVCCIGSVGEMRAAVAAGASAVGLVAEMPSGPGVIPEPLIAEIAARVPPGVSSFLLTSLRDPAAVVAQQRRCRADTVQLCDAPDGGPPAYAAMRAGMPGVRLVQVVHVRDADALAEALAVAPHVDAVLLDSGNPGLAVKQLGGTGRVHDWEISRRIREALEAVGVPLFLAGGLRADNVAAAVRLVRPYGLDICSGVRTDGRLDAAKLAEFMAAVGAVGQVADLTGSPRVVRSET